MYTNIVNFGPVTLEIEVWEICTFETIQQTAAYLAEYLNNYWTDLHQRFSFAIDVWYKFGRFMLSTTATLLRPSKDVKYGGEFLRLSV